MSPVSLKIARKLSTFLSFLSKVFPRMIGMFSSVLLKFRKKATIAARELWDGNLIPEKENIFPWSSEEIIKFAKLMKIEAPDEPSDEQKMKMSVALGDRTRWRSDPLDGMGDYVSDPRLAWYRMGTWNWLRYPQGPYINDCDDLALLTVGMWHELGLKNEAKVLSVIWPKGGHAVAVIEWPEKLKDEDGEYGEGDFIWNDYGKLRRAKDLKDVANQVVKLFGGTKMLWSFEEKWEDINGNFLPVKGKLIVP